MKQQGFTLIEILIVIAIMGILLALAGIEYSKTVMKYGIENQIRAMYADLSSTRMQAMSKNRSFFVNLAAAQYTVRDDSNENGVNEPSDTQVLLKNRLKYNVTWSDSADTDMEFNRRGLYTDVAMRTICIRKAENPEIDESDPDYDCLVVDQTKSYLGKLNDPGGACNASNCQAK